MQNAVRIISFLYKPRYDQPQEQAHYCFIPAYETSRWKDDAVVLRSASGRVLSALRASWLFETLARKKYEQLKPQTQAIFDFLKTRVKEMKHG